MKYDDVMFAEKHGIIIQLLLLITFHSEHRISGSIYFPCYLYYNNGISVVYIYNTYMYIHV